MALTTIVDRKVVSWLELYCNVLYCIILAMVVLIVGARVPKYMSHLLVSINFYKIAHTPSQCYYIILAQSLIFHCNLSQVSITAMHDSMFHFQFLIFNFSFSISHFQFSSFNFKIDFGLLTTISRHEQQQMQQTINHRWPRHSKVSWGTCSCISMP
jgi:hypothetical protein